MIELSFSPSDEETFAHRDESVKQKLLYTLQEAHDQIEQATRTLQVVRIAVRQEMWWELRGILTTKEIESLCSVSPQGLLDNNPEDL